MDKPVILSSEEINLRLKDLPQWSYANDKLSKEFVFNSFMDLMDFISDLGLFFEKMDHHADMHIYYKKIVFDLQRFDVGGKVTDRDFIVAKEIEKRYKEYRDKK